jgi:hypothetical protein
MLSCSIITYGSFYRTSTFFTIVPTPAPHNILTICPLINPRRPNIGIIPLLQNSAFYFHHYPLYFSKSSNKTTPQHRHQWSTNITSIVSTKYKVLQQIVVSNHRFSIPLISLNLFKNSTVDLLHHPDPPTQISCLYLFSGTYHRPPKLRRFSF